MALPDENSSRFDAAADHDSEAPSPSDAVPASPSSWLDRIRGRMPKRLSGLLTGRKRIGAIAVGITVSAVILFLILRPEQHSQDVQLQEALHLLNDRKNPESLLLARKIAVRLRKDRYRDPDFAGGVEYVIGITSFRAAQEQEAENRGKSYLNAVRYLREAEKHALDVQYRPEWAYSLGISLQSIGSGEAALPLLKEAIQTYPTGLIKSSIRLAELYLDRKNPAELKQAIELTKTILKSPSLTVQQKDRVFLLKAQVHLALAQYRQARSALAHVSDTGSGNQGARVFRAQTLMATAEMLASGKEISTVSSAVGLILRNKSEQKFRAALQELKPVSEVLQLNRSFHRRALLLMGICAERIAELDEGTVSASKFDAAISYFGRAAQNYAESPEGIAANLRLADLLRAAERDEEALNAYHHALKFVTNPVVFRNRWLSLKGFRSRILTAWNGWVEKHTYQSAIELAKLMPPLINRIQSKELEALAYQRWAEHLKQRLATAKFSDRKTLRKEMLGRWIQSGQTHGELAKLLLTSSRFPDVLWVSAEHFRKGHEFEKALGQFSRFIDFRPKRKLPLAIVRRGQVFMDLDRFDDALKQFIRVTNSYPTDPAAFEAQYEIGRCHLEMRKMNLAEREWRNILSSGTLTPSANEWRRSLYSLSILLFHSAAILKGQAESSRKKLTPQKQLELLEQAVARWEESQRLLKEYAERYPNSSEYSEVRFLLARAFQESAVLVRRKLRDAEVENVRLELRRKMHSLHNRSREEFRRLQTQLLREEGADLLDELGQRFLRDCYFEIANNYYALDQFEKAIVAYTSAANRYPHDPQVLLAYLQMANCNDRLGEPAEALSMLVQAKVILKQLPESAFQSRKTNLTKKEWETWLDWARAMRRTDSVIQ